MAFKKLIEMSTVKQVFKLYSNGYSYRKIAEICQINKETVTNYIKRMKLTGMETGKLLRLDDPILESLLQGGKIACPDERFEVLKEMLPYFESELRRPGVTRKLLWMEYIKDHPDGYSLTQFNEHLRQNLKASKSKGGYTPLTDTFVPGERMFIDFAGRTVDYVDMESGEVLHAQIFLATLPASDMGFIYAVESQRVGDFVTAMKKCLEYYGGVTRIWTPDNLKSAVTKADRYDPKINVVLDQMANHYGAVVIPARSASPDDKALVENQVKMSYRWIYAPLRDRVFLSIQEINDAFLELMTKHNRMRLTNFDFSREELFLAKEKCALKPLPDEIFQIKKRHIATVQNNYAVFLSEDKHFYTVPYMYLGQKVTIIYTETLVTIYLKDGSLIATHKRESNSFSRGNTTYVESHYPDKSVIYRKRSKEYYQSKAAEICAELAQFITLMFETGDKPEPYYYNSCDGLLHLAKTQEEKVAMKEVCIIAMNYGLYSYGTIKELLKGASMNKRLQRQEIVSPPEHENIRGKDAFK